MRAEAWRLARRLGVLLLLGAAASLAVAWGCAIVAPLQAHDKDALAAMMPSSRTEAILRRRVEVRPYDWTYMAGHEFTSPGRSFQQVLLSQHDYRDDDESGAAFVAMFHIWEFGWPFRSLGCERRVGMSQGERSTFRGVWRLEGLSDRFKKVNSPGLPFRPIWSGLAMSTIFYTGLLLLVVRGPIWVRSVIRRARGRCGRCGYVLTGVDHTVCPECGQPARRRHSVVT